MRTHYRNGNDIDSFNAGCDGCVPVAINGTLTHERGCPDKWQDIQFDCRSCGFVYYKTSRDQPCCESCMEGDQHCE